MLVDMFFFRHWLYLRLISFVLVGGLQTKTTPPSSIANYIY